MSSPFESLVLQLKPVPDGEALAVPCPTDLRWTTELPGGHKSLSCTIVVPAGSPTPQALATYSRVRVVDRRTGATIWWGELTDPGLTVERGTQTYSITAEGGQIASDAWREVFGVVDRAQESWQGVGEFAASSAAFTGELTPPGNIDLPGSLDFPPYNWDDLPGFGNGELPLDLPGFGDFLPVDYPSPAEYPGYLGFINPPWAGPGSTLAIPGTGGADFINDDLGYWPGWVPGITVAGDGTAITVAGRGRLTSGTTPNSRTSRRRVGGGDLSSLMWGGTYASDIYPPTPDRWIWAVEIGFALQNAGATAELWMWGDPTLSVDGVVLQLSTSGTISVIQYAAGTPTTLGSWSESLSTGVDYGAGLKVDALSGFLSAAVWPSGSPPGSPLWFTGTLDLVGTPVSAPVVLNKYAGVGVLGDGSSASMAVDFYQFDFIRFVVAE